MRLLAPRRVQKVLFLRLEQKPAKVEPKALAKSSGMRRTPAPMGDVLLTIWKRSGSWMRVRKRGKPVKSTTLQQLY